MAGHAKAKEVVWENPSAFMGAYNTVFVINKVGAEAHGDGAAHRGHLLSGQLDPFCQGVVRADSLNEKSVKKSRVFGELFGNIIFRAVRLKDAESVYAR